MIRTANLRVDKVLNNNVILARGEDGREVVAVGRGLGFSATRGCLSSGDSRIEKLFYFVEEGRSRFLHLLQIIDDRLIGACEEIISLAGIRFGQELSEHIHIALPEHLAFALERAQLGMTMPDPFPAEIQSLYPQEYQVAGEALQILAKRTGVSLPVEEQGFLTLHLVSARRMQRVSSVTRYVNLITDVVRLIMGRLGLSNRVPHAAAARLVVHLQWSVERLISGTPITNPLLGQIRTNFPDAYALATEACGLIGKRLNQTVSADDAAYLAIHIIKLQQTIS